MDTTEPIQEQDLQFNGHAFAQLRKLGLRPTTARICILQVLRENLQESMAVERIFQRLSGMGVSVSLGSIYRILGELEQSGLVHKEWDTDDPAGKARYLCAPAVQPPSSYAFVCRACGRDIVVAHKPFNELMQRQAKAAGFDRMLATISLHVTCNDCAANFK